MSESDVSTARQHALGDLPRRTAQRLPDKVAIIDLGGPEPGAFHDVYRKYSMRDRLIREHGTAANQVLWRGQVALFGDTPEARAASLIAATDSGEPLFGTPQKSPEPNLVVVPVLGERDEIDWSSQSVQLTFMTDMGAFEVERTVREPAAASGVDGRSASAFVTPAAAVVAGSRERGATSFGRTPL